MLWCLGYELPAGAAVTAAAAAWHDGMACDRPHIIRAHCAAVAAAVAATACGLGHRAGTYGQLQGVADHAAAIHQFTPPNFPEEWIPLMAQQMAQAPPSMWAWGCIFNLTPNGWGCFKALGD
jgi:hypothetical protein